MPSTQPLGLSDQVNALPLQVACSLNPVVVMVFECLQQKACVG